MQAAQLLQNFSGLRKLSSSWVCGETTIASPHQPDRPTQRFDHLFDFAALSIAPSFCKAERDRVVVAG